MFAPHSFDEIITESGALGNLVHDRFRDKNIYPSFKSFFLKIADSAFEEMEITLSPKISEGNRTIVENLIEKYNAKAILKESSLKDDIR